MSFGPSQAEKNAQNVQNGAIGQAVTNSNNANAAGTTSLGAGTSNINSGTNWFNTILNGNQANTASLLAPNINADRAQTQQALQSASTLMPRGGGRSASLFNLNMQPTASIQDMFNNARSSAAPQLLQTGLSQQGIGTNLFGVGNSALNSGLQGSQDAIQNALSVQQMSNQLMGGIGSLVGGLALAPVTGGGSLFGNLVSGKGCWIAEAIYGTDDVRTHAVRAWLNGPFRRTVFGRVVMTAYLAAGQRVADAVRRSDLVYAVLKPVFDRALVSATRRSMFVEVG